MSHARLRPSTPEIETSRSAHSGALTTEELGAFSDRRLSKLNCTYS